MKSPESGKSCGAVAPSTEDFAWLYEYELGTLSGVVFAADEDSARVAGEDAALDEARSAVGEAEAKIRRLAT